jgi:hypothetical protein
VKKLYSFRQVSYNEDDKGGEAMNGAEIMKNAMDEFKEIQEYMASAREENATKTYALLKDKYLLLKALLTSLGVNLTDIDKIKE